MPLGYTTIITSILPERAEQLECYLRKKVQPKFNPNSILEPIKCQDSFPFHEVKGLHLCSMVILPGGESDPPSLVFEATFDGLREEFVDDLLCVALEGINSIYENCAGYPESTTAIPELIKDYLLRHDVGAHTFYSGSPGRSVAQIKGEEHIHKEMVSFVCSRRAKANPPTTHQGLQRELHREVIRKRPKNQWAEQPAVVPWEVAARAHVAGLVGLVLALFTAAFGGLAFLIWGWGPGDFYNFLSAHMPLSLTSWMGVIAVWMIVWLILRAVELRVDHEDPRERRFLGSYVKYGLVILRYYALVVILLGAALWLDPSSVPATPTLIASCLLLIIAAAIVLWLWFRAASLKLVIQFKELTPAQETWWRYRRDVVRFFMLVVSAFALFIVGRYLPDSITHGLGNFAVSLLVLVFYILVGVLTAYILGFVSLLVVRCLELADRRRFAPATELVTRTDNDARVSVYEREEGGVNKYQNHLASLTYVKPGILRAGLLRLTLLAIGLLSRFWFNQGRLAGIPTILAARWALIEGAGGGRRLLFLTNYGGAWDSYLNEFIDMGAVIGLNAIWSNTFIKVDNTERAYAFPETDFYFWKGAEAEKHFKAYVRRSQIETIVWYGAYPTLTVININSNTDLRQAMFKPLAAYELDSVFHKAGL